MHEHSVFSFQWMPFGRPGELDPASPEDLRGWGSPTILVNGADVTGQPKGNSVSCRVYNTPGGVPDVQCIIDCLEKSQ